jgi:uncharacterized protein YggU (UPF0235/DUF167 family)
VVDGVLRCRVAAPPAGGAANVALVRLLARELRMGRSAIHIATGTTARTKVVEVDAADAGELLARWPGLAV